MKRGIVVVAAAALLVAGCSPFSGSEVAEPVYKSGDGVPEVARPAVQESEAKYSGPLEGARGLDLASGFLEFGDFDPFALGDSLFNPCTEISAEEWAAAGFDRLKYDANEKFGSARGLSYCYVEEDRDDYVLRAFSNGNTNRDILEEQGLILEEYHSELIPELIVFGPLNESPMCYTQVDTLRGGFSTSSGGPARTVEMHEMCLEAIRMMEDFYRAHGR